MGWVRAILVVAPLLIVTAVVAAGEQVCLIQVQGAIGPATASYISRAIHESAAQGAQCLIIELDTPGGLLISTQEIVKALLADEVPTVVYVAPPGATAGSAGCFITLAADVAAMAPATSIGAAHPVDLAGGGQQTDPTMKEKLESYSASYIEAIAARRSRNTEWARSAVKESAAIPAEKARSLGVVEIVARDRADLLAQLDGRTINGKPLRTRGAQVVTLPMTLREQVFQAIWGPEVIFILMLIVIYGLIGELSNPGAILPGVAGALALILVLYMSSTLPVNLAGVALLALSVVLFIGDAFAPTHGVLTVGGIIAFFLGSLMMFDRAESMLRLSLGLVIPATLLTAAFFTFIVAAGLRAQFLPTKVGIETMLGKIAPAITRIDAAGGKVFVDGEYWNAVSTTAVEAGHLARIVSVSGLTLTVEEHNS